jgi:hypothetical protein
MDSFALNHSQTAAAKAAWSIAQGSIPAIIIVITSGSWRRDLADIG